MELIGRKMYISHTDYTIALEKLTRLHPSRMELSKENPLALYDVFMIDGERIEKRVQGTIHQKFGLNVEGYFTTGGLWITKEEAQRMGYVE